MNPTKLRSILSSLAAIREASTRMEQRPEILAIAGADLAVIKRTAFEAWDDLYLLIQDVEMDSK